MGGGGGSEDGRKKNKGEGVCMSPINGEVSEDTEKCSSAFTLNEESCLLHCPIQGHAVKLFYRGK